VSAGSCPSRSNLSAQRAPVLDAVEALIIIGRLDAC
jgi:hypothetical protein